MTLVVQAFDDVQRGAAVDALSAVVGVIVLVAATLRARRITLGFCRGLLGGSFWGECLGRSHGGILAEASQ